MFRLPSGPAEGEVSKQLLDAQAPDVERLKDAFVTHAKVWADGIPISVTAFQAEGVPADVLRRAGFTVAGGRRGSSAARPQVAAPPRRRSRVTVDEVHAVLPAAVFTVKTLQEVFGASPAVMRRRSWRRRSGAGRLRRGGIDPDHRGPGRAPVLYRKA